MKFVILLTLLLSSNPMTIGVVAQYDTMRACQADEKKLQHMDKDAKTRCLPVVVEGYSDPI